MGRPRCVCDTEKRWACVERRSRSRCSGNQCRPWKQRHERLVVAVPEIGWTK